jgi:MFS family permease
VFYYGAVLWQAVGFSEGDALLINVISGAVSIAACLVALKIIDRVGRKPMLWFGSIGMAITLALMALAFSTATEVDGAVSLSDNMGILALLSANLYVMVFNGSWGPVMWSCWARCFNQIRGSGLAIAGLSQWLTNFAITMTFPIFLASIGLMGAYGLYAACAVISAVFVHWMVHEPVASSSKKCKGKAHVTGQIEAAHTGKSGIQFRNYARGRCERNDKLLPVTAPATDHSRAGSWLAQTTAMMPAFQQLEMMQRPLRS